MMPVPSARPGGSPPRLVWVCTAVAAAAALLLLGLDLRLPGVGAVTLRVASIGVVLAGIGGLLAASVRAARQLRTGALEAQRLHADNTRQLQTATHARDQVRAVEQRFRELVDGVGGIVWEA